jgi:excisionase family DNA binding protein
MTREPSMRPTAAYMHGEVAIVTGRVAAWLLTYTDLPRLRVAHRGGDPEVDAVLGAITYVGTAWRASADGSNSGSGVAAEAEARSPSEWMSTGQAADALGVTDRAVRMACRDNRLPAEHVDGRWRIAREDLEHYAATRAA